MKNIISVLLILTSFWSYSQNECYVIKGDQYGAVGFHTDELYNMVCSLVDQMDDLQGRGNSADRVTENFTVVTKLHYPILAYAESNFGSQRTEFFTNVESEYSSYFALSKEIDNKGVNYSIKIKFPDSGIFLTVNQLMLTGITKDVEDVMNGAYKLYKSNSLAEIAGYVKLKEILEDIEGNNYSGDIFERNEFYRAQISDKSILYSNGGIQTLNQGNIEIINYGSYGEEGVTISDLPDDLSRIADLNTYNLSMLIVISSKNDDPAIDQILETIESSEKEIKIWIHLDFLVPPHSALKDKGIDRNPPEIGYMLFRLWNNLTAIKAKQICDDKTSQRLDSWTEIPNQSQNPPAYDCSLGWKMGWNCLLPRSEEWIGNSSVVLLGTSAVVSGLFDGLLGNIEAFYNLGKGVGETSVQVWSSLYDFVVKVAEEGISYEALNKAVFETAKNYFETFKSAVKYAVEIGDILFKTLSFDYLKNMAIEIVNSIFYFLQDMWESGAIVKTLAYIGGLVLFDAVASYLTGGLAKISKVPELLSVIKENKLGGWLVNLINNNPAKRFLCRLKIVDGCFVKDTPVLMANNNKYKASALVYSMALLPIVSPIQNVQTDDLVKAYHHENSYYSTANNNNDVFVPGWQSYDYENITPETWQIGTFEIIEPTGRKVEVEANRPKSWYKDNNVNAIGDKAHFFMPEIGINGEATLISIRPTVVNTTDFALNESGMVDRPVITTFKRNASVIYDYYFSDGSMIGATPEHPFFSVDRNNYLAVGELQFGEQVMTAGQKVVKFIAGKQRDKGEPVYNFEVWREHNYYVGSGESEEYFLVHNNCGRNTKRYYQSNKKTESPIEHITNGHTKKNKGLPENINKSYWNEIFDDPSKISELMDDLVSDTDAIWDFKKETNDKVLTTIIDASNPKYAKYLKEIGGVLAFGADKNGAPLTKFFFDIIDVKGDLSFVNGFPIP